MYSSAPATPIFAAAGQAQEDEGDLADRAVGDDPLEVGLDQGRTGRDQGAGGRDHQHGASASRRPIAKVATNSRAKTYTPILTSTAACSRAVTGDGATPASGSHVWNGSVADFDRMPSRISSHRELRQGLAVQSLLDRGQVERAGLHVDADETQQHHQRTEDRHQEGLVGPHEPGSPPGRSRSAASSRWP